MNKQYSTPVILFGIVIPLVITIILLIIVAAIKGSLMGDFENNKLAYEQELMVQQQAQDLKSKTSSNLNQFKTWEELVSGDVYQKISSNLREEASNSPTQSMMITSESRSQNAKSLEQTLKRNIVGIDFSIAGTYQEIQNATLSLEATTPNLFLYSFQVKPSRGKLLNLNLTYLAWSKE
ncbi:hypothetical protein SAMN02745181_3621 [Rubritalea squalenifaciens DSM 18772]|uniref:Uncharacterized protein n=1 Tax=Rubritalea squalenifaciens DSM 18772 TaxID=1123071 RepID=A0A1M6RJY4_9BACT|nr:hypothetical protein [Rubritalea squalenifaciens]SHK32740.1 hypothetical protein SAMN02745181_3621 [Rubritalea squalenifaciens DSM 18772]